ncbi:MAG: class I SAM-dependent methyltransferase [Rhodospirillales bacterium]
MITDIVSAVTRLKPYQFEGSIEDCALCGASQHRVVGRRARNGQKLRTVLCLNCGMVYTNPMPTQDEVLNFYRRHYREHYQGRTIPSKKHIAKTKKGAYNRAEIITPYLPNNAAIVDVGSGGGEFVHEMKQRGYRAFGIEPHHGFAQYSRDAYGIEVINDGWETADISDGQLDAVSANHVLEHFRDPVGALQQFRSWLKPDGLLFLSVPNIEHPGKTPYGRFHFAHLYNFNEATFLMMTRKAGFEPLPDQDLGPTTKLLRPTTQPCSDWMTYPQNATRLDEFFQTYTNRRHFLTFTPYLRWFQRMGRLGSNMLLVNLPVFTKRHVAAADPGRRNGRDNS